MKKQIIISLATLFISFSAASLEQYVVDDLTVYVRRGPSAQHALIGTLNAGEKVTVLEKSEDGTYTRVKDQRGRISWIESNNLTNKESVKAQLPALTEEIAELKSKLTTTEKNQQELVDNYASQLKIAQDKIAELEISNNQLQKIADEQQSHVDSLNNQVDEKRQELILTWFTRGGLVAGIGLILGLGLPYIIPRKRKKDRWMN